MPLDESTEMKLAREVVEEAKAIFSDTEDYMRAELTVGGDEMGIGNAMIDRFDLDPKVYLRHNPIEFTAPVKVEVLLDEDSEIFYRLTFLEEA